MRMPPSPAVHVNRSLPVHDSGSAAGADEDADGSDCGDAGDSDPDDRDDDDFPIPRRRRGGMDPYESVDRVLSLSYAHPNSVPCLRS